MRILVPIHDVNLPFTVPVASELVFYEVYCWIVENVTSCSFLRVTLTNNRHEFLHTSKAQWPLQCSKK